MGGPPSYKVLFKAILPEPRTVHFAVGQADPTCNAHKKGVQLDNGRGSDVTSVKV